MTRYIYADVTLPLEDVATKLLDLDLSEVERNPAFRFFFWNLGQPGGSCLTIGQNYAFRSHHFQRSHKQFSSLSAEIPGVLAYYLITLSQAEYLRDETQTITIGIQPKAESIVLSVRFSGGLSIKHEVQSHDCSTNSVTLRDARGAPVNLIASARKSKTSAA